MWRGRQENEDRESSFYTINELWCNSAFRKEKKEAGEEVSNLRGSKRTMSCRNDRHLKFTPNF